MSEFSIAGLLELKFPKKKVLTEKSRTTEPLREPVDGENRQVKQCEVLSRTAELKFQ
jgi:hypothetical protein